jgi:hypothetical protein
MRQTVTLKIEIDATDKFDARSLSLAIIKTLENAHARSTAIQAVQDNLAEGVDLTLLRVRVEI